MAEKMQRESGAQFPIAYGVAREEAESLGRVVVRGARRVRAADRVSAGTPRHSAGSAVRVGSRRADERGRGVVRDTQPGAAAAGVN